MTIVRRPIIAVAGSSGKTTTKEMIASILQQRWRILKSKNNRNNRQAIRKHVKQIRPYHRAVVQEYGMSARGHLRNSCRILRPNMAVITMVGTAHIGNVGGSLKTLIAAKSELIKYMNPAGTLFLNADDHNSKLLHTKDFRGRIFKVGMKNHADYRAYDIRYVEGGMRFKVNLNGSSHSFFIPIYGTHNVYNALFAIAVTHRLGFDAKTIKAGLSKYIKLQRRMRVYTVANRIRVIDDTFNANPNSVKAAVEVLSKVGKGKNIAVLGDMMELGRYSIQGHRDVGRYVVGKKVDNLITYGRRAKLIGKVAVSRGFPAKRVVHASNRTILHKQIKQKVTPGATVLVKGSNATHMSVTVKYLRRGLKSK